MTIMLLCLAFIVVLLAWRASRVPIRRRWRRRQARAMCVCDHNQPPSLIYARLPAMDALPFEELLLESFKRRGCRVIRHRRYTGEGGVDGQVMIDGRVWLIQAKRYASAIRPEHVRAFVSLCTARSMPGVFTHTGRTGGSSRDAIDRHTGIEIVSGQRLLALITGGALSIGGGAMKLLQSCLLSFALVAVPVTAQSLGKSAASDERMIARCIHRSARGKPWLEKALWGLRDQEGG